MLDLLTDAAGIAGLALSLWLALSQWWRAREAFRVRALDGLTARQLLLALRFIRGLRG